MTEAVPARRRRWPLFVVAGLVAAIIFASWQLRSEKLAHTILDRLGPALGLELGFEGTPRYSLSPEPQLTLPNFHASFAGASTPLLKAKRLMISLPWDTLTGAESRTITRIELDEPVLHLGVLAAWQATRPDTPFEVPTLTGGLEVNGGRIVGNGWTLSAVEFDLPRLKAGDPARAEVAGRYESGTTAVVFEGDIALAHAGLVSPLGLDLAGTLSSGGIKDAPWKLVLAGGLDAQSEPKRLDRVVVDAGGRLPIGDEAATWTLHTRVDATIGKDATDAEFADGELRGTGSLPDLDFSGYLHRSNVLRFGLGGAIPRWPAGWPALPPPLSASRPMSFALNYTGATDLADPLHLRLQSDATTLDSRLVLPDVLAWMDRDDASPLPPIVGTLDTPQLVVGAFTLDGVHVEFDDGGPGRDFAGKVVSSVESSETVAVPGARPLP